MVNTDLQPKDRILAAATELFATNGYSGTGMTDLEKVLGMGRSSIYYHVRNKEQILFEIIATMLGRVNVKSSEITGSHISPKDKLLALVRILIWEIVERPEPTAIFYRDWKWLTGDNRSQIIAERDRFEAEWHQVFLEGVESGDFVEMDSDLVPKFVLGLVNYAYIWYDPLGRLTPEELTQAAVDVVLYGIASQPRQGVPQPE